MASYRGDKDILGRVYQLKCQMTLKVTINHAHFSKAALLVPSWTIGADLVILAETGDELLRRQDHFGARLSVKVPNDLEDHDQSCPFSKAALLVPRCTIGADLVILAETGHELSRRQGRYGHLS